MFSILPYYFTSLNKTRRVSIRYSASNGQKHGVSYMNT